MACARCSSADARDSAIIDAKFLTPSGQHLYVHLLIGATKDAGHTIPEMFCERCWLSFLELFHQIGEAHRVTLN